MKELGIDVLICGAISRPMETSIFSQGIKLYPFVRGTVDEIVNAYREKRLNQNTILRYARSQDVSWMIFLGIDHGFYFRPIHIIV